jgi:putative lipoic acid-binding regulatory protein
MSDENDTGQGVITEGEEEQGKLSFPCTIGIKAMGRQTEDFERTVIEIVAGHVGEESIIEVTCRESSGGKYHSVTCEVKLENRQEMEAIYQTMFDHPDILMTL